MGKVRILLADDHQVVRRGIRAFLESQQGFEVVAEAGDGREAVELALELRPDLVVLDIAMPGMDGLAAMRELKAAWPECLALCLTVHDDRSFYKEMLAAGASAYVTKQAAPEELLEAIRAVAAGEVYLQPALARWLIEDLQRTGKPASPRAAPEGGLETLSAREREVLELVAQGFGNAEIGDRLGLSPKTIARHRERIMKRLDLHSRTDLVRFAIRTGLVKLD